MVDIKLSTDWELTAAATGDAPITDDIEGFLQTLKIEALTQEGELFYDEEFGWSLLDFVHAQETELIRVELESRIRQKLTKQEEILADSIEVHQQWANEDVAIQVNFKLTDESIHQIDISLDRVRVEVS